MDHRNRVILNIGGTRFEAYKHTLRKIPATRLSRLTKELPNFDPVLNEYFYDRHPGVFPQILNYYRSGKLHYPKNVCGPLFEEELAFWGLDANQVEPCCWMTYTKHRTTEETLATLDRIEKKEVSSPIELRMRFGYDKDYRKILNHHQRLRMWLWQIFEEPHSSLFAKVATSISLFFIVLSVVIFNVESIPIFQKVKFESRNQKSIAKTILASNLHDNLTVGDSCKFYSGISNVINPLHRQKSKYLFYDKKLNVGNASNLSDADFKINFALNEQLNHSVSTKVAQIEQCYKVKHALKILDLVANSYLTFELVLRLLISPNKCIFFRSTVNLIDTAASIWYFFIMFVQKRLEVDNYVLNFASNIRVFRIFQVLNHHTGLRVIVASLEASAPVLWLFVFVFLNGMIIGATLVYYAERAFANSTYRNDLESKSIFHWWWFAVVTATTVGYGDIYPETIPGKFCGAYCAVIGVLAADVPMAIIVQTFSDFYKHQSVRAKLHKKRCRPFQNNLAHQICTSKTNLEESQQFHETHLSI